MKDDKYFFDFRLQPGLEQKNDKNICSDIKPRVSIITSIYNTHEYMWQTVNCILNQSFPFWEWIVVDDGSTRADTRQYLEGLEKVDSRIKVYKKENGGLAKGRDYAISKSSTDYILPIDSDDLIEPTYIETVYWAMELNKNASWAFTNSVGFGKYIYLTDYAFDSDKMKKDNQITATALIRKKCILELGGYSAAKRYINEDWHLWLRMLANGKFPVQIAYYGFWYRRREESLLSKINDSKSEENNLRLKELKNVADKIRKKVYAVIYPKNQDNHLIYNKLDWDEQFPNSKKEYILCILPTIGYNSKLLNYIKKKSEQYNVIIIDTENSTHSKYASKQKYEKFSEIFSLSTFLDTKDYLGFIEYVIKSRNINKVYLSNNRYFEDICSILKDYEKIDYRNSEIHYNIHIISYKICNSIVGRVIRKMIKKVIN